MQSIRSSERAALGRLNRIACAVSFCMGLFVANAGVWRTLNYPLEVSSITCIYHDVSTNSILVAGSQILFFGTDSAVHAIMRYRDGTWDTLCTMDQPAQSIIRHADTLIVAGSFSQVDGEQIASISYLNGDVWMPYGNFNGPIYCLKELSGSLYVGGGFLSCDGAEASGIAFRSGGLWSPLGIIPYVSPPTIRDLEEFQGEIVATGLIRCNAFKDLVRFNGSDWLPIGGAGLLGGISGGNTLAIFDDDLIVGGTIDITAGNAGHAIMGWNGVNFFSLGIGPQYIQGSYEFLYRVNDVVVKDGLLFAGGGFNFVDEMPASRVAVWNGAVWCGLGGDVAGEVRAISFFGDSLVAATWDEQEFDGADVNNMAKYQTLNYADTCAIPLNVFIREDLHLLQVYPNPVSDVLSVDSKMSSSLLVELRQLDGRIVKTLTIDPGRHEIYVGNLLGGIYHLYFRSTLTGQVGVQQVLLVR